MTNCPYCGNKLEGEITIPLMSDRKRRIYDAVSAASSNGINRPELLKIIYDKEIPPGGEIVLRVQVHELNKLLKALKQRIIGKRYGGYHLVSTK